MQKTVTQFETDFNPKKQKYKFVYNVEAEVQTDPKQLGGKDSGLDSKSGAYERIPWNEADYSFLLYNSFLGYSRFELSEICKRSTHNIHSKIQKHIKKLQKIKSVLSKILNERLD